MKTIWSSLYLENTKDHFKRKNCWKCYCLSCETRDVHHEDYKIKIVEDNFVINVKDKGTLQMFKMEIGRGRLFEIVLLVPNPRGINTLTFLDIWCPIWIRYLWMLFFVSNPRWESNLWYKVKNIILRSLQ